MDRRSLLIAGAALLPLRADDSRYLPKPNRTKAEPVAKGWSGKSFLPAGTVGTYKKGKTEYRIFIAKTPGAANAASLLLDWKKALANSKFIAGFGGYFGLDQGQPAFLFTKGAWIAALVGLPEKQADLEARGVAILLN